MPIAVRNQSHDIALTAYTGEFISVNRDALRRSLEEIIEQLPDDQKPIPSRVCIKICKDSTITSHSMELKRLYRSHHNKVFAGICGGIGEYCNIDPTVLRLIWVLVVIFTGFVPGVLVYIIAYFVIPPMRMIV